MKSLWQFALCGVLLFVPLAASGQLRAPGVADGLPDAPEPQTAQQSSSAAPASQQEAGEQKTQQQTAEEQLREQKHQRVLGILPAYNTSYRSDAVSLTAKQKLGLAMRTAVDPFTFATAFVVAGYGEAVNSDKGFDWGAKGYFERSGAKYLDTFDGALIGNGILPSLLHQDPRYFRRGHGSVARRLLYAAASGVICKHDNTGKWEPNYSNVGGNFAAGFISMAYYPDGSNSVSDAVTNGITVLGTGTIGAALQEFWPDVSRKLFHKDPTRGLDAQAAAADKAAKAARQKP